MEINFEPKRLKFTHPFRIAHGMRTHTDIVYVTLRYKGFQGMGEAALPPYLPDTQKSVIQFLEKVKLPSSPIFPPDFWEYLNQVEVQNLPAKAALDMALWDIYCKENNTSIAEIFNLESKKNIPKFFTLAICNKTEMQDRIQAGIRFGFSNFKLKLDGENDLEMIKSFRSITANSFAVDANQSWKTFEYAKKILPILEKENCILIEQPFDKKDRILTEKLNEITEIPIIADEACQTLESIFELENSFTGINIKLQKCGGITPALKMIEEAKKNSLKILIGCMSESIIGCGMAENLLPLCDWNDLDGQFLSTLELENK